MKITKSQLKQIIKEELGMLKERQPGPRFPHIVEYLESDDTGVLLGANRSYTENFIRELMGVLEND